MIIHLLPEDQLVTSLSNEFWSNYNYTQTQLKIELQCKKKINYSVGSGFGFTFDLLDKTMDKEYKRNYTNFFPSASLQV
jgi:hypothetical protein